MKNKINEASVKIDVQGLESSDLETLSRILSLAGQAEKSISSPVSQPQQTAMPAMPDLDGIDSVAVGDTETPSIMDTPDMSSETSDVTLDLDGQPMVSSQTDEQESLDSIVGDDDISTETDSVIDQTNFDDDFDMQRMADLAGIAESSDHESESMIKEDDAGDAGVACDDQESQEVDFGLDESLLPDLSIDKGQLEEDDSDPFAKNERFGPFDTERAAVVDAQQQTNGVEGDNFIVIPEGNRFYWERTLQEDIENRAPQPEVFDDDGIINSRHEYRHKRTHNGDNPILSIDESEQESGEDIEDGEIMPESDDDELEKLHESLMRRYQEYISGGKKNG